MQKTERKIDVFILIVILGIFIFVATFVLNGTENLFRFLSYVFFAFIFLLIGFLVAYLVFFRQSDQDDMKMNISLRQVLFGTMTLILVVLFIKLGNDAATYYDQRLHYLEKGELPPILKVEGLHLEFMLLTAAIFGLVFTLFGLWLSIKK